MIPNNLVIDLRAARARVAAEYKWNEENVKHIHRVETEEQRLRGIIVTMRGALEVAICENSMDRVEEIYIHLERASL